MTRSRLHHRVVLVLLLAAGASACSTAESATTPHSASGGSPPPNILLIVADDLGSSDLGVYGGEIATPNVDALARDGVLFTQFHAAPNCGPARGALLTGVDSHRAGLGGNVEVAAPNQRGRPGYLGYLRDDVVTMGELLRDAGYHTYMAGKWHLGHDPRNLPPGRGFERSFALMNGAASHWPDQAPIIPGAATLYVEDGEPVAELPDDFYSTRYYTDRMIEFIAASAGAGEPFFGYLAYTAPHNPLHVPAEHGRKYRGRYDRGWDALAEQRVARMRELGLLDEAHVPHPRPDWIFAWEELTPEQRSERARDMELYAGMIDLMDEEVGRLVEYLREIDQYENTLIVFLSDNGPSKTTILDYVALGGEAAAFFERFDNSLENKGLPGSSTDVGPGWAYASAAPLRLFKGYVAQGGIQVPAIVKLPRPSRGVRTVTAPAHVIDVLPTFLEVAGVAHPETYGGVEVAALQGTSLMPLLTGSSDARFDQRGLGWEAYGMNAYRRGDWKVLRLPEPYGNGEWQLYDLAADPGETSDLAAERPDLVDELSRAWQRYAELNGVILPSEPVAYGRPVQGLKY